MSAQDRVSEILSWYSALTSGQKLNLLKLINTGKLAGTGKFVILPVDQGFEHGPARSFAPNPAGYDPVYHVQLAVKGGCNAYAAPLGAVEAAYDEIKKSNLPIILKCNSHDLMMPDKNDPLPAVTAWVDDAVRLGLPAVGFTIYPGSAHSQTMYQQLRELVRDATKADLIVVVWSYPRGSGLPNKEAETAIDVVAYAVHIACQLGAHLIKCKPPTEKIGLPENEKIYKKIKIDTLSERVKHIVQSAFGGKRIVIFSGGPAKEKEELLTEVREIKAGGGFGSIVGRNTFQRPEAEALQLLAQIIEIYKS